MKPGRAVRLLSRLISSVAANPRVVRMLDPATRGIRFGGDIFAETRSTEQTQARDSNPLLSYFMAHTDGPGIHKYLHYFDIYHRHFARFIGREVRIMEVGVYSGGSLRMWREYFGPSSRIYGVDIEPACLEYKAENIDILIGDQGDRAFWRKVKETVPKIDIFIDDGSHLYDHQMITLEEMLPHIGPEGVFLCEDIHGSPNDFAAYLYGLASTLNSGETTDFLKAVDSIHLYPFVGVIEKAGSYGRYRAPLSAPRHGTEWAPFSPYAAADRAAARL